MGKFLKGLFNKSQRNKYKVDGTAGDPREMVQQMQQHLDRVSKDTVILFGPKSMAGWEIQKKLIEAQGWMHYGISVIEAGVKPDAAPSMNPEPEAAPDEGPKAV